MKESEEGQITSISNQPESVPGWVGRTTLGCCSLILVVPLVIILISLLLNFLPQEVSLEKAHYDTEKFVGREVRLKGWLRRFEGSTGIHYGIEDSQENRVGIREYDTRKLEELIGQQVLVEGKFIFDEQFGIYVIAMVVKPSA